MKDVFYTDLIYVLVALLITAILGFFIGWLVRGYRMNVLKKSLDTCYNMNRELKKKLVQVSSSGSSKVKISSTYVPPIPNSGNSSTVSKPNFDNAAVKKYLGKAIKENDLKIVEGIGPKIEQLINSDGITNWEQLSKAPVSRLKNILKSGGDRFTFHKPDTWPSQAKLAFDGKWEELKKLQDYLEGGVDPKNK